MKSEGQRPSPDWTEHLDCCDIFPVALPFVAFSQRSFGLPDHQPAHVRVGNMTFPTELVAWRKIAPTIGLLAIASVGLNLSIADGVPLAAFATISALLFDGAAAFSALLVVWLANLVVDVALHRSPTDIAALMWCVAQGAIGLASVRAAIFALSRYAHFNLIGVNSALVVAFVVAEVVIFGVGMAIAADASQLTLLGATRAFLLDLGVVNGFAAIYELWRHIGAGKRASNSVAFRSA